MPLFRSFNLIRIQRKTYALQKTYGLQKTYALSKLYDLKKYYALKKRKNVGIYKIVRVKKYRTRFKKHICYKKRTL